MSKNQAPVRDFVQIADLLKFLDDVEPGIPEDTGTCRPIGRGIVETFETMIRDAGERLKADRGPWVIKQLIADFAAKDEAQGNRLSRIWKDIA